MREPADRAAETFLGRWSRLKRSADEESSPPVAPAAPQATPASTRPPLTDADMPAVDTLGEHSDFSGFLSEGVSEELRRLALRKLFGLPQFNQLDGLNDYDEDFTKLEPLGDAVTYQMRQWAERRARAAIEADAGPAEVALAPAAQPARGAEFSEASPGAGDELPGEAT